MIIQFLETRHESLLIQITNQVGDQADQDFSRENTLMNSLPTLLETIQRQPIQTPISPKEFVSIDIDSGITPPIESELKTARSDMSTYKLSVTDDNSRHRIITERSAEHLTREFPTSTPKSAEYSQADTRLSPSVRPESSLERRLGTTSRLDGLGKTRLQRIVNSAWFGNSIIGIILMSAVIHILESEYLGDGLGVKIGYQGQVQGWSSPHAIPVFLVLDWICGCCFTVELILKILALGPREMARDIWSYFDGIIVVAWILEIPANLSMPFNAKGLRFLKCARVLRVVRLMPHVAGCSDLILMVEAIKGCVMVFLTSLLFLFLIILAACFVVQQLTLPYIEDESMSLEDRHTAFMYFGTFSRSVITMWEISTGNYFDITRFVMEKISLWIGWLIMIYAVVVAFAVMQIIGSVFIQGVFEVAQSNDEIMVITKEKRDKHHVQQMVKLFKAADDSGDAMLTQEELDNVLTDPRIATWLSAQNICIESAEQIFEVVASGRDKISAEELVKGVSILSTPTTAADMLVVGKRQKEVHDLVGEILWQFQHIQMKSPAGFAIGEDREV